MIFPWLKLNVRPPQQIEFDMPGLKAADVC